MQVRCGGRELRVPRAALPVVVLVLLIVLFVDVGTSVRRPPLGPPLGAYVGLALPGVRAAP